MKKAAGLAVALALCFGLWGTPVLAAVPPSVASWDDLLAAVAEAAATPGDYTITITAPLTVTGPATLDGQGSAVTLVRGAGVTGDLITLPAGQSLSLQNITIDGGGAAVPGVTGPLIHCAGDLQIGNRALMRNNLATGGTTGGGVYVANGGTLALAEGGAVSGNAVSPTGGYGGGVYVASGGGFAMTGGTVGGAGNAAYFGGGVYIDHAAANAVSISGGVISENMAVQDGGGLYLNGGTVELTGAEVRGNTANYGGGAYVNQSSGWLSVRGTVIQGNSASAQGGGVFVQDDAKLFVTGTFPQAGVVSGNSSGGHGADICLYDIYGAGLLGLSGFAQVGAGSRGIYDANNGSGGQTQNIYVSGPLDAANGAAIVVEGISQTPAPGVIIAKAFGSAYGGSYETLTNDDRNAFTYVNRAGEGYRVYLADAAGPGAAVPDRLVLAGFDLQEEVYEAADGGTVTVPDAGYGMAASLRISARDGTPKTVALTGGEVYRQAFTGTLVEVPAGSGLTLRDISLRGSDENGDSLPAGPLVWVGGALTVESGARLTANNATADGAAIYVSGPGGVARMSGGAITGNTAAANGAVYVGSGGLFAISGGEVTGNTARLGGGVYVAAGGQASATGGTVGGNLTPNARDIYLEAAGGQAGRLALSGAPIIGRQAGGGYTGGVYNALADSAGGNLVLAGGLLPGALVVVDGAFDPAAAPVLAVADPALYPTLGENDRSAVHYVNSAYTVQFNTPASPTALVLAAPPMPVTGLSVSPASLALAPGDTAALTAIIVPANATNRAVGWQSSDPSVATVDANGLVTAVAPGVATITATTADGGFTATAAVTVTAQSSSASSSSSGSGSSSGTGGSSGESANPAAGATPGSPPTGDAAPLALWLPLALAALAALAGLAGTRFLQYSRRRSAILASERPAPEAPHAKSEISV